MVATWRLLNEHNPILSRLNFIILNKHHGVSCPPGLLKQYIFSCINLVLVSVCYLEEYIISE